MNCSGNTSDPEHLNCLSYFLRRLSILYTFFIKHLRITDYKLWVFRSRNVCDEESKRTFLCLFRLLRVQSN